MKMRNAFTLIELLVVIAIIAILAAILFPVFARARESARRATCQSNEKQLGLGLIQYLQDFDEMTPPIRWTTGSGCGGADNYGVSDNKSFKWMDMVYPYIKNEQVFTCPDDTGPNAQYSYAGNYVSGISSTQNWGSYLANDMYDNGDTGRGLGRTPPFGYPNGCSLTGAAKIQQAASTVWLVEGIGDRTINAYGYRFNSESSDTLAIAAGTTLSSKVGYRILSNGNANAYGCAAERHSDTTNVLWCDGHVKSVKLDLLAQTGTGGNATYFTCEADPN